MTIGNMMQYWAFFFIIIFLDFLSL